MLRRNVASQHVAAQMNSRTDGSPLTTGVSVYYTGDAGSQTSGGGTLAHKNNGHWDYIPAVGETNYDHVAFTFIHSTGVNVTLSYHPVSFNPTDSVRIGLTALPNAAANAAGGLPVSVAGGLNLDSKLANTNEITAARLSELDAATSGKLAYVADVIAVDVAGLDGAAMRGTDSAALASVCTEGRLAELDAANLPTDVANVQSDTTAILLDTGTDGVIVASLGTQAKADVNAEADAALADANLDHVVGTATGIPTIPAGTYLDKMMNKDANQTFDPESDSLEAIRDHGDSAWRTGASGAADVAYTYDAGSTGIVIGDVDNGTIADTTIADGTPWTIGEIAGTITYPEVALGEGIRVEMAFAAAIGDLPVVLNVWARYAGGAGHSINVYMYDYVGAGWELVGNIPNSAAIQAYSFPTHVTHISGTGEMKVMFHHADGTGIASHALSLDKVEVENQTPVSAGATLLEIEASTVLAKEATVDALPLLTEIEASTVLALEATVLTVGGKVDNVKGQVEGIFGANLITIFNAITFTGFSWTGGADLDITFQRYNTGDTAPDLTLGQYVSGVWTPDVAWDGLTPCSGHGDVLIISSVTNPTTAGVLSFTVTLDDATTFVISINIPAQANIGGEYLPLKDGTLKAFKGGNLRQTLSSGGASLAEIEGSSILAKEATLNGFNNRFDALQMATGAEFESIYPWVVDAYAALIPSTVYGSDGNLYTCILTHTSSVDDEPGVGINWATYWSMTADAGTPSWVVSTPYSTDTAPRVNDPAISYDQTWPVGAGIRLRAYDLSDDTFRTIGDWDGTTWTINDSWNGSPNNSEGLYISYMTGATPLPAGILTISVPSVIGTNPRVLTINLPYWEDSRDLDLLVRADGSVTAWRGGTIVRASSGGASLAEIEASTVLAMSGDQMALTPAARDELLAWQADHLLTHNCDYLRLVPRNISQFPIGANIGIFASDDRLADDWNYDIGSLDATTGAWTDGPSQGTIPNNICFGIETSTTMSFNEDFVVRIERSQDGITWRTVGEINLFGCGRRGYVMRNGTLRYDNYGSNMATYALGSMARAAFPGDQMDLVDAPNATARDAIVDTLPTLTEIEASTVLAKEATVDALPLLTEIEGSTVLAKDSSVAFMQSDLTLVKTATDKLRFTIANQVDANTLSGGGAADWTGGEKEQIRSALGVDGTKTTAAGGQLQDLHTDVANLPTAGSVVE